MAADILSKVKLAVISAAMLSVMFGEERDEKKKIILAKNYSKEIEYSEENLEKIYETALVVSDMSNVKIYEKVTAI